MTKLLQPIQMGDLTFRNRIAMAPITRARAGADGVPVALNAEYYAQRATAGLIITEATNVSPNSAAFELAPAIYNDAQVAGWRRVTEQVHAAGGRMFMQLWHGGRVSSYALLNGAEPLSPSGVNDDLGLLQFLSPLVNRRTDEFGGSVENRARFLRLVIEAVLTVFPKERVGVRISPYAAYNNATDPNVADTYGYVVRMLNEYGVAYIHGADTNAWGGVPDMARLLELIRSNYDGVLMANAGLTPEAAQRLVEEGKADMIAFGRLYVSNPDLPARIAAGGPYNEPDPYSFYGGTERGYTDYSALVDELLAD